MFYKVRSVPTMLYSIYHLLSTHTCCSIETLLRIRVQDSSKCRRIRTPETYPSNPSFLGVAYGQMQPFVGVYQESSIALCEVQTSFIHSKGHIQSRTRPWLLKAIQCNRSKYMVTIVCSPSPVWRYNPALCKLQGLLKGNSKTMVSRLWQFIMKDPYAVLRSRIIYSSHHVSSSR
jgi:hypothetical protein